MGQHHQRIGLRRMVCPLTERIRRRRRHNDSNLLKRVRLANLKAKGRKGGQGYMGIKVGRS